MRQWFTYAVNDRVGVGFEIYRALSRSFAGMPFNVTVNLTVNSCTSGQNDAPLDRASRLCAEQGNGRAGDETPCLSLFHGPTSSTAAAPTVDLPVVPAISDLGDRSFSPKVQSSASGSTAAIRQGKLSRSTMLMRTGSTPDVALRPSRRLVKIRTQFCTIVCGC